MTLSWSSEWLCLFLSSCDQNTQLHCFVIQQYGASYFQIRINTQVRYVLAYFSCILYLALVFRVFSALPPCRGAAGYFSAWFVYRPVTGFKATMGMAWNPTAVYSGMRALNETDPLTLNICYPLAATLLKSTNVSKAKFDGRISLLQEL